MIRSDELPYAFSYHHNPLTQYVMRSIPGARTPQGLYRYTMIVGGLVFGLGIAGWLLLLLAFRPNSAFWGYASDHIEISWEYLAYALGASAFFFAIVDLVTVFFAAASIRIDKARAVQFDLLRTSPLEPAQYIESRVVIAKARTWRVFVVLWAGRLAAWVLLVLNILWTLGFAVSQDGWPRLDELFLVGFVTLAVFAIFVVFTILFLLEPFWRLDMLTRLAVSIAARIRSGLWAWMMVLIGLGLVVVGQGGLRLGCRSSRFGSVRFSHLYWGLGIWVIVLLC